MYLVYSAIRSVEKNKPFDEVIENETSARYFGYLAACNKHRQTIAEIQQYLPGWEPPFPVGSRQSTVGTSINHDL